MFDRIAMLGCGKLGLPCALAMAKHHDVVGYDKSPVAKEILTSKKYPHREVLAQEYLKETTMRMVDTVDDAVRHAEILFIAVQTPHQPRFEGTNRMPEDRADFGYEALRESVGAVAESAKKLKKRVTVVVISTALPGSCEREVYPLLNEYTTFVYNPFFIAMGSTISDHENPEFILLGCDDANSEGLTKVKEFYSSYIKAKQVVMGVKSAELCKVAYNVFLGLKIVAANSIMEIAHKIGANCDDVTNALALATDRVVSPKYMKGGGGDSGGCHPRDQIALSWLAQKLDLSYDLLGSMIYAREAQTEWLAKLAESVANGRPIVVLGKAYKKGINLTIGSYATLLKNILDERSGSLLGETVDQYDPHTDPLKTFDKPAVFIVATNHDEFKSTVYPAGSVIIDPWGMMQVGQPEVQGSELIRVGRN